MNRKQTFRAGEQVCRDELTIPKGGMRQRSKRENRESGWEGLNPTKDVDAAAIDRKLVDLTKMNDRSRRVKYDSASRERTAKAGGMAWDPSIGDTHRNRSNDPTSHSPSFESNLGTYIL